MYGTVSGSKNDSGKCNSLLEQQLGGTKRKKITRERNIEMKKEKLIDAANNLLTDRAETNAFGVYVGKKIDEIPLGQQRDLAEKLISDILFLAKTNNLTFNTRIENPSRTNHYSSQNSSESYFLQSNPFSASHTQHQSPASSHSYLKSQLVNTSTLNYLIPTQSPTPPFFQSPAYSTAKFINPKMSYSHAITHFLLSTTSATCFTAFLPNF
ncbi:unnamed protein product [Pieris macdunnoughi]|uniref:Uncharacterized protein n=1 Tax=Pieris macdunnoughi TaxID=345717 RepID=A0A821XDP3_9NEOP|nr:unnamed protein product [Pieris macdunnoughi]